MRATKKFYFLPRPTFLSSFRALVELDRLLESNQELDCTTDCAVFKGGRVAFSPLLLQKLFHNNIVL